MQILKLFYCTECVVNQRNFSLPWAIWKWFALFFLLSICKVMFNGAGKLPFKKALSLQSYLNKLIEDKILCMATMSEVLVSTCKSLYTKELDWKILSQIILLFWDILRKHIHKIHWLLRILYTRAFPVSTVYKCYFIIFWKPLGCWKA